MTQYMVEIQQTQADVDEGDTRYFVFVDAADEEEAKTKAAAVYSRYLRPAVPTGKVVKQ